LTLASFTSFGVSSSFCEDVAKNRDVTTVGKGPTWLRLDDTRAEWMESGCITGTPPRAADAAAVIFANEFPILVVVDGRAVTVDIDDAAARAIEAASRFRLDLLVLAVLGMMCVCVSINMR
jgi:hypothetical protein